MNKIITIIHSSWVFLDFLWPSWRNMQKKHGPFDSSLHGMAWDKACGCDTSIRGGSGLSQGVAKVTNLHWEVCHHEYQPTWNSKANHMYGLFTYIYHKFKPNVGKYTILYMDPMGMVVSIGHWMIKQIFTWKMIVKSISIHLKTDCLGFQVYM